MDAKDWIIAGLLGGLAIMIWHRHAGGRIRVPSGTAAAASADENVKLAAEITTVGGAQVQEAGQLATLGIGRYVNRAHRRESVLT